MRSGIGEAEAEGCGTAPAGRASLGAAMALLGRSPSRSGTSARMGRHSTWITGQGVLVLYRRHRRVAAARCLSQSTVDAPASMSRSRPDPPPPPTQDLRRSPPTWRRAAGPVGPSPSASTLRHPRRAGAHQGQDVGRPLAHAGLRLGRRRTQAAGAGLKLGANGRRQGRAGPLLQRRLDATQHAQPRLPGQRGVL